MDRGRGGVGGPCRRPGGGDHPLNPVLDFLGDRGPLILYGLLGAGSAIENIIPPIPADTFILLGAFLAAGDKADAFTVFLVTWLANTLTALLVYRLGLKHGQPFFEKGVGRFLLNPNQLERMRGFYDRWGLPAIFFARFLPGFRAMVPVFAGVTRQRFLTVAFPVLVASGIWYGGLVWMGATAGRNLDSIQAWFGEANRVLLGLAVVAFLVAGRWWLQTRRVERKGGSE